jgi:ketosteroid isomerase-like protein
MPTSSFVPSLLVLASFVGAVDAAPVPPETLAKVQLQIINHRFVDAYVQPNTAFIDALTHTDFLLTHIDGAWYDRAAFVTQMAQPFNLSGASYEDVRVRLYGSVAIVHGKFEALQSNANVMRVRYTDVYLWTGSAWQLVSAQNTPIKPDVEPELQIGRAAKTAPWLGQDPIGNDKEVLRKLNDNYVKAYREADVAWYDAHLAADYVVVSSDGSFQDRAQALTDFAQPSFATLFKSFPVAKVNIRQFGDIALIHAENAYEMKDGRKGISRYTDIWHKSKGKWRCVAAHITSHQAP